MMSEEIEKFTGVNGLSMAKIVRGVAQIGTLLRTGSLILGIGTATLGSVAAVFASSAATLANAFLALGIPVAQSKVIVRERNLKNSFRIGCTVRLLEYGLPTLKRYRRGSPTAGFGSSYMFAVAQTAFNVGLLMRFVAAKEMSAEERRRFREELTNEMINHCKSNNLPLQINMWSAMRYVSNYAKASEGLAPV